MRTLGRRAGGAAVAILATLNATACKPASEAPRARAPVPAPLPAARVIAPVEYVCEGGEIVRVGYPDQTTALVTYRGQTWVMKRALSADGGRYTGADRQWWSKAFSDREDGTLSVLKPGETVATQVIAKCVKRTAAPGATATGAVAGATPAPGPTPPTPTHGERPCASGDLALKQTASDAGAGQRSVTFGFTNLSKSACSLRGYPTLALFAPNGRKVDTVKVVQSEETYFQTGGPPTEVTLQPNGRAVFYLAYSVVPGDEAPCPAVSRVQVTPPGGDQILEQPLSMQPCGGQVRISPMRAEGASKVATVL